VKKLKSVFGRDMCVAENTSRPANVGLVRLQRTSPALRQAAVPLSEKAMPFLTVSIRAALKRRPDLF